MTRPAPHHLPPLPWLRAYEAAARRGGFTAAAAELGLTQAAVSQQVGLLEAQLGARLFRRLRRGVELTAEGAAFLPHVQAAFAGLARSTAELFGKPSGRAVALQGPVSFLTLWLAPRLARFGGDVPGIDLNLSTIQVPAEIRPREHDFDIRFGLGAWDGRTAHRLTTERLTPVCAPALMGGDWHALPRLGVIGAREMWSAWAAIDPAAPADRPFIGCDTFITAMAAAEAGAGVLLGSRPLIDRALDEGRLVRLSALELPSASGHFVTHGAGTPLDPAQSAVLHWLLRQAAAA